MASPESTHDNAQKQHSGAFESGEQENAGGLTLRAPAFNLTAGPIQRFPDPAHAGQTDYRMDTGRLTANDLQDPQVVARLQAMTPTQLEHMLTTVHDPQVAEYIQSLISQRQASQAVTTPSAPVASPPATPQAPAAAAITDTRTRVLPQDEAMYTALTTFLQALPARMRALVATPPASFAYLQNNPNVEAVIQLTEQVAAEFAARQHIVRFDPTLVGGRVAAAYGFTNDTIRLRPFTSNADRNTVVSNLLHEYTHYQQDRVIEQSVASTQGSDDHSQSEELDHEVGGRRSGAYMGVILLALGEPTGNFEETINDNVFVSRFERERTGNARERRAATAEIRSTLRTAYTRQLDENSPGVTHYVHLGEDNHIYLHIQGHEHDLGEVPSQINAPDRLSHFIADRIQTGPHQYGVFRHGSGRRAGTYQVASFLVYYHDRKLTEFAIRPS